MFCLHGIFGYFCGAFQEQEFYIELIILQEWQILVK